MSIQLEELIKQLPPDTDEKVRRAKDRFNSRIREALRSETRFYLRRRLDANDHRDEVITVPISILPGLPPRLSPREAQSIDETHRLSLLLAPYRHVLAALRDSSKEALENLIPALRGEVFAGPQLDGAEKNIDGAWRYAEFLLKKLNEFGLTKFILRVNSDVLGIYRYRANTGSRIELYWGIIGLVARDLGIPPEDLTCVTLAHELAHAYTHVGADADNRSWATAHFAKSMRELIEGLAQYYTERVCRRIEQEAPGAIRAYEVLLPHQPPPYQVHASWKESQPEHVRLAMLEVRRTEGGATLAGFETLLEKARDQLRP